MYNTQKPSNSLDKPMKFGYNEYVCLYVCYIYYYDAYYACTLILRKLTTPAIGHAYLFIKHKTKKLTKGLACNYV